MTNTQKQNIYTRLNINSNSPSDKWANYELRNKKEFLVSTHATKGDAARAGRELAKKNQSEHRIHNEDGKIIEANSYGNDPKNIKG